MIIGKDFVVLGSIDMPETVQCGEDITVTADIWNIGEKDQDDIYIEITERILGINERIDIGAVDSFEKEDLSANIKLPSNTKEGNYALVFTVYDDNDDIFESEDSEKSEFTKLFKIEGSCKPESKASISASLVEGGQAGKSLVVKAVITNSGTDSETFTLRASDYESWADAPLIEPSVSILDGGDSKDVLFTFQVNKDVSGDQIFNIEAVPSGEGASTKQVVAVTIEAAKPGFNLGITGFAINKDNWYLWGIGALNVLLVLIIIIVAIRVARS